MLEAQEREIDGSVYWYQPLMATPARELLDQLIRKFGPAFAAAVEGLENADLNLDQDTVNVGEILGTVTESIGGSIREAVRGLEAPFHHKLVEQLGKQSQIKNTETQNQFVPLSKDIREVHFATNLLSEFKWIAFCLEVQYSDFFALLRTTAARAVAFKAQANESKSRSRKDLTGISKESQATNAIVAD